MKTQGSLELHLLHTEILTYSSSLSNRYLQTSKSAILTWDENTVHFSDLRQEDCYEFQASLGYRVSEQPGL